MPSRILITVAALATLAAAPLAAQAPTWVILVRHAEKAATPAGDPPLSPEGTARARLLAQRLEFTKLDAIITTQFERTRATAAPTAEAHRVPLTVLATAGATHVQAVVDEIRKHVGGVVLVVGHSNTVPAIIAGLGAPAQRPIYDAEYDNLYIVQIPASGTASVVHTRFGLPSPTDVGCAATMK